MGHFGVVGYFVAQCIRVEAVKEGKWGDDAAEPLALYKGQKIILTCALCLRYKVGMRDTSQRAQRLQKTSVQIPPNVKTELVNLYPEMSLSEIVRMALQFVLDVKPTASAGKSARFDALSSHIVRGPLRDVQRTGIDEAERENDR